MKDRKWFLEKFDSGEKFSEDELQDIAYGDVGLKSVERSYGENRRWTRTVTGVYEADGRYFMIDWEEGLTEHQEDEFWEQPVEVEKKQYEKTFIVTEWVKKEDRKE